MCERSLATFTKHAWHIIEPGQVYQYSWHIGAICEHLQALSNLEIKNLVINVPIRCTKSILACVAWCPWVWTKDPASRWYCSSYSESLVMRDSVRSRDIIRSDWYQRQWGEVYQIKADQDTKMWFSNDQQGHRIGTTVGGKSLGHGADYVIVDDPHNPKEIRSSLQREWVIDWWVKYMSGRFNDPAKFRKVIVMQRLHEKDLSGYVLAENFGYHHLALPIRHEPQRWVFTAPEPGEHKVKDAIVQTPIQKKKPNAMDPRTVVGESIWKDRFTDEVIRNLEAEQGHMASGMLYQRPSNPEGEIFKSGYFRYFDVVKREVRERDADGKTVSRVKEFIVLDDGGDGPRPQIPVEACRFFQAIDTAATAKKESAYTGDITFALLPGFKLVVWHAWRAHLQTPELMPCIEALKRGPIMLQREDGLPKIVPTGELWPKPLMFQAVEEKSTGIGIIQQGAATGKPFKVLSAGRDDKIERSSAVAAMYFAGNVYHRRGAPWLFDFEDELKNFPRGEFKDFVDCLSYGGILATHDKILRLGMDRDLVISPDRHDIEQVQRGTVQVHTRGGEHLTIQFPDD